MKKNTKLQNLLCALVAVPAAITLTRLLIDRKAEGWILYELVWAAIFFSVWYAAAFVLHKFWPASDSVSK